jgi:hypothetical protein
VKFDMNAVLRFAKDKWPVLAMGGAVLIAAPASFYFSTEWRQQQIEEFNKRVSNDRKDLTSARVTYTIQPLDPSKPAAEFPWAPNAELNEWFRARRAEQMAGAESLVKAARDFNIGPAGLRSDASGKVTPLVPDLFPAPSEAGRQIQPREMARVYLTEAHAPLLKQINAGGPPSPESVTQRVSDRSVELTRAKLGPARAGSALTAEEFADVTRQLTNFRVELYKRRALDLGVYADERLFGLPAFTDTLEPSLAECWQWQRAFWVQQDVIRAVGLANAGSTGGVTGAVVKRLERVLVVDGSSSDRPAGGGPAGDVGGVTDAAAGATTTLGVEAPRNPAFSVTGRVGGAGNGLYDVALVDVVAVVSSKNLPKLIDALGRTNFITVLDMDIYAVDIAAELQQGYFYGDEHVVRVSMRLETIWLHDWTLPLMPAPVRNRLGLPAPTPESPATPAN